MSFRISFYVVFVLFFHATFLLAQSVTEIAPSALERGLETFVVLDGTGFLSINDAYFDDEDLMVSSFSVLDDNRARLGVQVSNYATLGAKLLIFEDDEDIVFTIPDAIDVVAGDPEILFLTPNEGTRGDVFEVQIGGRNLDIVDEIFFGPGISSSNWTATNSTRVLVEIDIGPATPAGFHNVILTRNDETFSHEDFFSVQTAEPEVWNIAPLAGMRGEQIELVFEGRNLDAIESIDFGSRIDLEEITIQNPLRALFRIFIHENALLGERTLQITDLNHAISEINTPFLVQAGSIAVSEVRPNRVTIGDEEVLFFEGKNLDLVHSLSCGAGITVNAIDAHLPLQLQAEISVHSETNIGFRDCIFGSEQEDVLFSDAIIVENAIIEPVLLRHEADLFLGEFEVGSLYRRTIEIENIGATDETITVGNMAGDLDIFALIDENGQRVSERTFELATQEIKTITVEFSPIGQNQSSAEVSIFARSELVSRIRIRALGVASTIGFSPESPAELGVFLPNIEQSLPRIDMILDGGLPETIEIDAIEFEVRHNNNPIDPEAIFDFQLQSSRSGELFYWGNTELQWSFSGPIGSYRGKILVYTQSNTATTMPLSFSFIVQDTISEDTNIPDDTGINDTGINDTGINDTNISDIETNDTGDINNIDDSSEVNDVDLYDVNQAETNHEPVDGCQCTTKSNTNFSFWILLLGFFGFRVFSRKNE